MTMKLVRGFLLRKRGHVLDYKKYQVTILPIVLQKINDTFDYIETNFSEEYANKKEYIALYFIDDMREEVVVTPLLPSRSDYIKLFK